MLLDEGEDPYGEHTCGTAKLLPNAKTAFLSLCPNCAFLLQNAHFVAMNPTMSLGLSNSNVTLSGALFNIDAHLKSASQNVTSKGTFNHSNARHNRAFSQNKTLKGLFK